MALIDIAPDATPNAESRLRRALAAADFPRAFPGTLPVVHERLEMTALRSLPWALDRWFAASPALTVVGGPTWMEGVRTAMANDPAWELPGQPKAPPEEAPALLPDADGAAVPAHRTAERGPRLGRLATLPVAFAGVFGLGLLTGVVLLETTVLADRPKSTAAAVPLPGAPEAGATEAQAQSAATQAPAVDDASASVPDRRSTAASQAADAATETPMGGAGPLPEPGPAAEAPPAVPVPQQYAARSADANGALANGAASDGGSTAGSGMGASSLMSATSDRRVAFAVPGDEILPMAPPRAPAPPTRTASASQAPRMVAVIDRACSQALFRFQQGERLTAADQSFIRSGCVTARR